MRIRPAAAVIVLAAVSAFADGPPATSAAPSTGPSTAPAALRVVAPGGKWAVLFDLPGGVPADTVLKPDGKTAAFNTTAAGDIALAATVEPTDQANAKTLRAALWPEEKKDGVAYTNVRMSGDENIALVRFHADGNPGAIGFLVRDGMAVIVRLSHAGGTNADFAVMETALRTLRTETTAP